MRKLVNEILKGKNLKENLNTYISEYKGLNHQYAYVRLALNYYTFYQIELDQEDRREEQKKLIDSVNKVIRDAVLSDKIVREDAIRILDEERERILKSVSALTYFVDVFKNYEHALNRVEYRFKDHTLPKDYSDEELCRMLMQYILGDEDNVVINSKISEVIAELPIRMTKGKFFEHLSNGLSIYKGSDRKTLKDFLYMIKTSAMITEGENYIALFPELQDVVKAFDGVDFSKIDENEYKFLSRNVEDVSVFIEDVMNISMIIMEIMNDTYSIILTQDRAQEDKVITACREIVAAVNDYFILGSEIDADTEDQFVMLEGSQENLYQKLSIYNIRDEIMTSYGDVVNEEGLTEIFEDLSKLEVLSSDSLFAEFGEESTEEIVDDVMLEAETNQLIDEFKKLFAENARAVNRAVMNSVLAQLPVFFNNISELQDFIYQTLEGCKDMAEKRACIDVLHQIMEE